MKVFNVQATVLGTDDMKVQYAHALKDLTSVEVKLQNN